MDKVTVLANAKLNLYLDVLGKRPDGYHDLDMLMVTVNCGDVITVRKADKGVLSVKMDGVPAGEENTAFRTAKLVSEYTGSGLDITIAKKIPVGAGMGMEQLMEKLMQENNITPNFPAEGEKK